MVLCENKTTVALFQEEFRTCPPFGKRFLNVGALKGTSFRNMNSCVLENFWKSLSLQQVTQIQSDLIFCDLMQWQNSVVETDFHKNSLVHMRRFVTATCCPNILLQESSRMTCAQGWSVATTFCCNLSPSVYPPLKEVKSSGNSKTVISNSSRSS